MAAIVTGGASGLGAATAERLTRAGARVTIFGHDVELGKAKAAALDAHFESVDVTEEAAAEVALSNAEAVQGSARILVNCAGIGTPVKVIRRDGSAVPLAEFFPDRSG